MTPVLIPKVDHEARPGPNSIVFAFQDGRLVLHRADARETEPIELVELEQAPFIACVYLGQLGDRGCFALGLAPDAMLPARLTTADLRDLYSRLDDGVVGIAGRAFQLIQWWVGHAYCGRCGAPTEAAPSELARRCPECAGLYFPRINPAVITMVERDGRILLARNRGFRGEYYSVLAGFVEPGETLECAVAREVREEVSVEVHDIRYFGSQSWPFPSQIMIGFTAQYLSGEILIQEAELSDASWFEANELPKLPRVGGMGRRLVESFIARHSRHEHY